MKVRTRFAPSPTGFMHVGGVRTALFAYLFAKKHDGDFILRIEDTDKAREVEGAIPFIQDSLAWLGISPDEGVGIGGDYGPYVQSEKKERYIEVAKELLANGHAYIDTLSEEETQKLRDQAEANKEPFLYRNYRPDTLHTTYEPGKTVRFKISELKRYTWTDLVRGELSAGEEALDDFVIIKADGYPTYNLAHMVDDHDMKITHIMRGEEFISSTPKFLALYEALGYTPPEIATMPVILGENGGKKLSKRDGAKSVLDYKAEGYVPEALVNFLALLGWHPQGDNEILSMSELIEQFDVTRLQKAGARFDATKLEHFNQVWLRKLSDEKYAEALGATTLSAQTLEKIVPLLKERATTFEQARAMLTSDFAFVTQSPAIDKSILLRNEKTAEETALHLRALETLIEGILKLEVEDIKSAIMPYADKEGRAQVLWPLRYLLSGEEKSPDPFTLIHLLGKEESLERVRKTLAIL
jgi:nondiscriminating glutamyl-tRNA synthetase